MEHGNDKELITANAIDQGDWKPAEQDLSAAPGDGGKCLGVTHSRSYGSVYCTREL